MTASASAAVARNGHGLVEEEALSTEENAHEALVMGLRLAEGVDAALVDANAAERLAGHGLLWRRGNRVGTTESGRLLLDSILVELAP